MLEKIVIFIIFLGPLVFFHELGHFLFARLFGVRVEVFSVGFGPKILKKKWGDTEYAVSLIPLGGYVKMFGDDPFAKDEVPEADRAKSFNHKGKWARFWIVMGGPLANFILAFVIFFSLLMIGEKIPEIKLGSIDNQSILYTSGVRTGDVIVKVNGNEVYNPADLMVDGNNAVTSLTVRRHQVEETLNVNIAGDTFFNEVTKYPPFLRKPIIVDVNGNKFGLSQTAGKVDLDQTSLEEFGDLVGVKVLYAYPILGGEDFDQAGAKVDFGKGVTLNVDFSNLESLLVSLNTAGFKPLDLVVKNVSMGSAADKSGIRAGDIFSSLEGEKIYNFSEFRNKLQEIAKPSVSVEVYRAGELLKFDVSPELKTIEGKELKLLGVESLVAIVTTNFVQIKSKGFMNAVSTGLYRTWDSMKKTVDGFLKLITNQVSLKSIGGPLAIGKVAHDSFNTSLSYFFQLMALISVNLGVVNLFPVPVLDGGHIMFIGLEVINRGPLSRRKMEIAQQVGLSLLLLLMVGAIFNDVTRFF